MEWTRLGGEDALEPRFSIVKTGNPVAATPHGRRVALGSDLSRVRCPTCGAGMWSEYLMEHVAWCKPRSQEPGTRSRSAPRSSPPPAHLHRPPSSAPTLAGARERTIARSQGRRARAAADREEQRLLLAENSERCAACGAVLRRGRLERHQRRAHDLATPPLAPARLARTPARAGRSSRSEDHTSPAVDDREAARSWVDSTRTDRADATRGLGYLAREGGRFGSSPAFDAMDDESGA